MDPNDRIAQPRIDPARTPFEDTAAFRRYGVTSDPEPDALEALYTKAMIQEQGFDGLPRVVSRRELDRYIAGGGIELFRGVTRAVYAEAFREGTFFVGHGGTLDGMYAASGGTGFAVARQYAAGGDGAVIRMSVKPGARIVDVEVLEAQAQAVFDATVQALRTEQVTAISAAQRRNGDEAARRERAAYEQRMAGTRALYTDLGRYAAYMGYDAVREPDDVDVYYVVLNRTALRVQRENMR